MSTEFGEIVFAYLVFGGIITLLDKWWKPPSRPRGQGPDIWTQVKEMKEKLDKD